MYLKTLYLIFNMPILPIEKLHRARKGKSHALVALSESVRLCFRFCSSHSLSAIYTSFMCKMTLIKCKMSYLIKPWIRQNVGSVKTQDLSDVIARFRNMKFRRICSTFPKCSIRHVNHHKNAQWATINQVPQCCLMDLLKMLDLSNVHKPLED